MVVLPDRRGRRHRRSGGVPARGRSTLGAGNGRTHAVLLTGGAAFGLDATGGAALVGRARPRFQMRTRVPFVPSAVLFDLAVGRGDVRPDAAMGYAACEAAGHASPAEGSVGAGTGATVGKALGLAQAMRGGIGTAACDLGDGVLVGALVAVNAFGDGSTWPAGRSSRARADPARAICRRAGSAARAPARPGRPAAEPGERFGNTVIVAWSRPTQP
jgi:L-aminopeptidase/D-esterase-like protein